MEVVTVRRGEKYSALYTRMLRRMVREHVGAELIVAGDGPDADVSLPFNYEGWWSKIELFSPELESLRPCFFLDLDTYILGDSRGILDLPGDDLLLIRDFNRPERGNSGLMVIPKDTTDVWAAHFADSAHIDGNFLNTMRHGYLDDHLHFVSYKKTSIARPAGHIVCFHGKPKPHETTGWAGEVWQTHTR